MAISIVVHNASTHSDIPTEDDFRDWVQAVFAGRARGEVGIRVVAEDEARALNRRYRSKDYATNVLAFPGEDDFGIAGAETPIGDIVICAAVVESEAHEHGCEPRAHWAHLTVHGALHLDGYDHETDEQAAQMQARESTILGLLGLPDPWAALARTSKAGEH